MPHSSALDFLVPVTVVSVLSSVLPAFAPSVCESLLLLC